MGGVGAYLKAIRELGIEIQRCPIRGNDINVELPAIGEAVDDPQLGVPRGRRRVVVGVGSERMLAKAGRVLEITVVS